MEFRKKGLRVSIALFKKSYLLAGRLNEMVATFENLDDYWKPGEIYGVPPFVKNCNC